VAGGNNLNTTLLACRTYKGIVWRYIFTNIPLKIDGLGGQNGARKEERIYKINEEDRTLAVLNTES
jgi:hypothetical protein